MGRNTSDHLFRRPVVQAEVRDHLLEAAALLLELAQALGLVDNQHRHSGIGMMTPSDVHHDRARRVRLNRARTLDATCQRHPERFLRKPPTPPQLPTAVWINTPQAATIAIAQ